MTMSRKEDDCPGDNYIKGTSNGGDFIPLTDWFPALDVDQVRVGLQSLAESRGLKRARLASDDNRSTG